MKTRSQISLLCLLAFLSACPCPVAAQDGGPRHNHSLEVSAGHPSLFTQLQASSLSSEFSNQGIWRYEEDRWTGSDVRQMPALSLAFRWEGEGRHSDFLLMASFGACTNRTARYTRWNVDGHYPQGGYWSGLQAGPGKFNLTDASLTALWRFKWGFCRHCHFYSSTGIGLDFVYPGCPCPIPYISPVGISIGESGCVYGFLELNISGAAFLGLGGIGIRL